MHIKFPKYISQANTVSVYATDITDIVHCTHVYTEIVLVKFSSCCERVSNQPFKLPELLKLPSCAYCYQFGLIKWALLQCIQPFFTSISVPPFFFHPPTSLACSWENNASAYYPFQRLHPQKYAETLNCNQSAYISYIIMIQQTRWYHSNKTQPNINWNSLDKSTPQR